MMSIRWLERLTLVLLHAESLAKYGGLPGMRDEGLLEGALARPRNLHGYEGAEDIVMLAACYGVAIANQADAAAVMIAVAEGEVGQPELADWLRRNVRQTLG